MAYNAANQLGEIYDASKNPMAAPHTRVIVNLNVNVDVSGNVELFGASEEMIRNIVVPALTLNVNGLYSDNSNALIEFWEENAARGEFKARIGVNTDASGCAVAFATSLATVLKGAMDASAAAPFGSYEGYTSYSSFGELVLSYAAEGMFGHPQATAAITNDVAIVAAFNNDAAALAYTGNSAPVSTGSASESGADKAIAARLAHALLTMDDAAALVIAQQVIGQDAGRATLEDNNELPTVRKQSLRWYAGDVVYVSVTLENFTHSMGPGFPASAPGQQYGPAVPPTKQYYLRLTLA